MKKIIGVAMLASAAMSGAANAEVSGNVALVTDYVFRGVSLSDNGPAVQGGFDWTSASEMFYAGVWGSSLADGMELDAYAGVTPTTGPVNWDIGVVGYFYPDADDDAAEFDYFELLVSPSMDLTDQVSVGGTVGYAPENYGDTGDALYLEVNGSFAVNDQLAFSAAFGNQSIEDPDGGPGGADEDDYNTWNIGGSYAMHGFTLDLRYHDTDIEDTDDIAAYTYGESSYDSNVVLSISRAL